MQHKISRRKCTLLKIQIANNHFLRCRGHCLKEFKHLFPHLYPFFQGLLSPQWKCIA